MYGEPLIEQLSIEKGTSATDRPTPMSVQTRSSRDLHTSQLISETVEEAAADSSIDPHEDQANASTDRGSEEEREDSGLEKHLVPSLDVKTVDLLLNVFAPKTMGKCLIFVLGFMLANYLWGFLVWIVNIRNPFRYIGSNKVLNGYKRDCHLLVAGYFPFKNANTLSGYRAFAASAMMLHSGLLEDEFTCLGVITSELLAREVGMRFDGDIVTYSLESDSETRWSFDIPRTADNIVEWVKRKRSEAIVKWIHSSTLE
ncbi:unnamed protein product [Angiostrongylus costaricensis]|uniref:DEP domain-containing protein n=1 Tax=Angiostrongylus costaricensis TaxID=334426 RepID=A0A0R3PGG7_ANGCS|nr:unnamed protein product [Angiostrongylus costaricensis]